MAKKHAETGKGNAHRSSRPKPTKLSPVDKAHRQLPSAQEMLEKIVQDPRHYFR